MKAAQAAELRAAILRAREAGRSPTEISRDLGCSRTSIYRALSGGVADGRRDNPGWPPPVPDGVLAAVLAARADRPTCGPRMIRCLFERYPAK